MVIPIFFSKKAFYKNQIILTIFSEISVRFFTVLAFYLRIIGKNFPFSVSIVFIDLLLVFLSNRFDYTLYLHS